MDGYENMYAETRFGFNTPDPFSAKRTGVYRPVQRMRQGESLLLVVSGGSVPLDEESCDLQFTIKNNRFNSDVLFRATYLDPGVFSEGVSDTQVLIRVPESFSNTLARGGYNYTVTRADKTSGFVSQVEDGELLVDYDENSPAPEIPYNIMPPL